MRPYLSALVLLGGLALAASAHADTVTTVTLTPSNGYAPETISFPTGSYYASNSEFFEYYPETGTTSVAALPPATGSSNASGVQFHVDGYQLDFVYAGYDAVFTGPVVFTVGSPDTLAPGTYYFTPTGSFAGEPSDIPLGTTSLTIGVSPEPSSLVLLGTGILGLAGAARRRLVRA